MTRRTLTAPKTASLPPPTSAWPIRPSSNGRYLVNGKGDPWFMIGDNSLQSIFFSANEADCTSVFTTRAKQGFNASWSHVYGSGATFGTSVNGNPFIPMTNVANINEAYFAHIDRMLNVAKSNGILIFLGVSGLGAMVDAAFYNNGPTKLHAYGAFLGNRWKNQGNICWFVGNDWDGFRTDVQNNAMLALVAGISSTDTGNHPFSLEIYPTPNLSTDAKSRGWGPYIDINCSYTYAPSYTNAKKSWNVSPVVPCTGFEYLYEDMGDANNDNNNGRHGYRGNPHNLRKNAYWGILYGTLAGYHYGNESLWRWSHSDIDFIDSTVASQMKWLRDLFSTRRWYDLIPDHNHSIGTAGLGQIDTVFAQNGPTGWMDDVHATAVAATSDGRLLIAFMSNRTPLTINMARLVNGLSAKWFNPTNGVYSDGGGPFTNSGSRSFTPPSRTGDNDWALILE